MSLFAALVPHPDALDHLAAAVAPVRAGWPSLRWVRPERWHVTAAFLGDVAADAVPGLVSATRDAVARLPAPTLRLAGAGGFPGRGRPLRVLWVGVEGEVGRVAAAAEAAAREAGVRLERREHVPHLTLARVDRPRRGLPAAAGDPVAPLSSYAGPVRTVPALHLLESRPGSPGPYEVVAAFPLAGTAPGRGGA